MRIALVEVGAAGVNEAEIGGVRAFWREAPGPMRAGFVFRTGFVDERLVNHGITHLIEHMILRAAERGTLAINGVVEPLRTAFFVSGETDEAVGFVNKVVGDLTKLGRGELPLDRLDLERQVLLTEAAGRGGDALGGLLAYRWGPRGVGLAAYEEFGLHSTTEEDLAGWAARFFTSGNAALWMTRQPPPELDLGLTDGSRVAVPEVEPLNLPTPGWFARPTRSIACGMTLSRSFAASALAGVLEQRLKERIRHDLGLSYDVVASYLPYSVDHAHLALFADALPENAPKVREALYAALHEVAADRAVQQELDTYRSVVRQAFDDPGSVPGMLDHEATRLLTTPKERFDLVEELDRLDSGDVAEALVEALPTAVYLVAAGDEVPDVSKLPDFSSDVVKGKRYSIAQRRVSQMKGGARHQRLIVGDEGASLVYTKNKKITVRFDRAEGLARWSDGSVCLFGSDGFTLVIRPDDWRFGRKAVEKVERGFRGEPVALTGEGPASPLATSLDSPRSFLGFAILAMVLALGTAINVINPDADNADAVSRAIAAGLSVMFIAVAVSQFRKYRKAKEEGL